MNELDLDISWRIGEKSFSKIVQKLLSLHPTTIVEFGSGASSIRLAQKFEHSKIVAIDHDKDFFFETTFLKNKYHIKNLEIYYCPLQWQVFGLCLYKSYSNENLPKEIDVVIIDGPPYYAYKGREYCLHCINKNIKTGGLVILDDYQRFEEKNITRNWKLFYPDSFQETLLETDHHLCILKIKKELKVHINIDVIIENYSSLFLIIVRKIKSYITKIFNN